MPLASANPYPYMLYVEQGSTPSNPSSGNQRLFVRSSDHVLCMVNSSGTVTALSGSLTNPMTTQDDTIIGGASGTPGRLAAGSAGASYVMGNGHVIWGAGSSFPGSKATNDVYRRTDLACGDYWWDGTQWRCRIAHEMTMGVGDVVLPNSLSNNAIGRAPTPYLAGGTDIYLVSAVFLSFHATLDGSNFWTLAVQKITGANSATTVASRVTSGDTASNWTRAQVSIAAVLGTVATYPALQLMPTKTGSPGNIYGSCTLVYNHVST